MSDLKSDEISPADFLDRLQFCANRLGSVSKLSRISGIATSTLAGYFRGDSDVPRARLIKISQSAGVSLLWLATGEGTPEGVVGELDIPQGHYPEKTIINVTTALYEYLEKDKSRLNPFVFGETVALLCRLKPDGNIDSALIKSLMDFKSR